MTADTADNFSRPRYRFVASLPKTRWSTPHTTLSKLENGGSVGYGAFLSVARALGIIDQVLDATDPWQSDLGRMRANQNLPQRVRHRG